MEDSVKEKYRKEGVEGGREGLLRECGTTEEFGCIFPEAAREDPIVDRSCLVALIQLLHYNKTSKFVMQRERK